MRRACSVDSERLIPHLPAVTVRAVVPAPRPDLRNPLDRRQLVLHPGGQQKDSGLARRAAADDAKPGGCTARLFDRDHPDGDALVGPKLLLRGPAQLKGRRAVMAEEPVYALADAVRRVVGVQQQDSPPHAAQDQRSGQAGGTAADDRDVKRRLRRGLHRMAV
jgi:hypothetical protein